MVDVGAHYTRSRNEPAARAEIVADTVEQIPEAKFLAVARQRRVPERGVARGSARAIEAPRALQQQVVDVAKNDPCIDVGNAIVVAAEHSIRVGDANSRLATKIVLRAQDVVERTIPTRR